jgi:DNA polymerase-3 subunit gamma/tau
MRSRAAAATAALDRADKIGRMSYQVLARKWRPRDFASLVGQEHVVRALRHALEEQRLHHAYLFTGTRGVGKTTLARILAKCLNCERGVTAEPCGRCSACSEIDAGRFVDLLEVDAATNTRVDEMRQLLDTAQYAPTRARYKIYVIDEVHMLSTSAFNAMLKTLEEPPEHLKFILATTDPQKIPVTVLSRCLQFNLKQMPPAAIAAHLAKLLDAEGIAFEPEALAPIARAAAGSMRDALSLLDQAIAHGAGRVALDGVQDMLGAIDRGVLLALLEAVAEENGSEVMRIADEMQSRSLSFDTALADLAGLLLQMALAQTVPGALEEDLPERARIEELARSIDPELVQLDYQIALQGRADLPLAPDEYAGFVMTLLRMIAFRTDVGGDAAPAAPGRGVATVRANRGHGPASQPASRLAGPAPHAPSAKLPAAAAQDWTALVGELAVTGAAGAGARPAAPPPTARRRYELVVPKSKASLAERAYQDKLKAALEAHLGREIVLKVSVGDAAAASVAVREAQARDARQADATRAVQQDAFVQELVELFDARVVESTIRSAPGEGK